MLKLGIQPGDEKSLFLDKLDISQMGAHSGIWTA